MFSKMFNPWQISALLEQPSPSGEEVEGIFSKPSLSLEQAAVLVAAFSNFVLRQRIVEEAVARRTKRWGGKLFLLPPLYISDGDLLQNGCLDHCIYCPWRNGNVPTHQLKRLSPEAVKSEAQHLLSLGYGDIELVAAADPELLKAKRVAEFVRVVKSAGAKNIGINLFPLKQPDDYQQLASTGCTFTIVWQETYEASIYREMHSKGPKSNFQYRLDAHDRALLGGIKTVGLAFLGGLADWRFETLATIEHAQYLKQEYGANIIFGMPRWKPGPDTQVDIAPYRDDAFEFVGALYSLAIPEGLPWFSTREHFDLSARCASGGGCLFTLDCSTEVGGYTNQGGFAQFPVYSRSFSEGVEWLKGLGFKSCTHLPW